MSQPSLVIYLPDLSGGGAERLQLNLAQQFSTLGYRVTLLVNRATGELLGEVPAGCDLDILPARRQLASLPGLTRYFRDSRPSLFVTNTEHMTLLALAARWLARSPARVITIQHITLARPEARSWRRRALPWLFRLGLPQTDAIVAVSQGIAAELGQLCDKTRITVIPNGVAPAPSIAQQPHHLWLEQAAPLVLAIGRLVPQKDFATLLRAFAALPDSARLILLGEGPERGALTALAASLGVASRVDFPGFVSDPTPYLQRANVLALSSVAEGFGNVIVEALACGTPVVATDCPHGPAEILDGGRFGHLVPMGNPEALANAITRTLAQPPAPSHLRARAADFTLAACAEAYHRLFTRLLDAPR